MKGPLDRTKVVLRHLPPSISQSMLMEQIDGTFAGRYHWVSFVPGKNSVKRPRYARAYIDFNKPEDVIAFAEFFNGTQFKTIVEYAPSQRTPKQWSKKDGREGTILKDPDYLEFLENLAKPVENLPSAEVQLERKEAERAGVAKDVPVTTPLMDYVRQKRAAKSGSRRSLGNGKISKRAAGGSTGSSSSGSTRRGSEKKKYVQRDSGKNTSSKEKSTYILVNRRDDLQLSDKSSSSAAVATEVLEGDSGISGSTDTGKKKILLLKGKEREISHASFGMSQLQSASSPLKGSGVSAHGKLNQRREGTGRIIRSILLNKDARQSHFSPVAHSEQPIQNSNAEKDKRPPRPPNVLLHLKDSSGAPDDKVAANDLHGYSGDKQEKRTRSKERPDRGVWTPLRRSDGSHASDDSLSSSASQSAQASVESSEGPSKHVSRRGQLHVTKDSDGSPHIGEGKASKRGGSSGHGSHELCLIIFLHMILMDMRRLNHVLPLLDKNLRFVLYNRDKGFLSLGKPVLSLQKMQIRIYTMLRIEEILILLRRRFEKFDALFWKILRKNFKNAENFSNKNKTFSTTNNVMWVLKLFKLTALEINPRLTCIYAIKGIKDSQLLSTFPQKQGLLPLHPNHINNGGVFIKYLEINYEIHETGIGDNGDRTYLEESKGFVDLASETNSDVDEILNALFPESEVEFCDEQIQETGIGDHQSDLVDLGLQKSSVVDDDNTLDWAELMGSDEISMGQNDIIDGFSVEKNGGGCFDQDSKFMGFPGLRFKEFPDPAFEGFDEIQFQSQENDQVFGEKSIWNYMDLAEEFIQENNLDSLGFAEMDCSGVL
ncbi:UPF3 domain [Dillenia turbinata]|uniref:UPF3 domain n=1 Tax=Dillenia turbinata TaxID=194707 RepID=A0AAN8W544_9MAGN